MRPLWQALALVGWLLMYNRDPQDARGRWKELGAYPTEWSCDQVRAVEVERETLDEIGRALAGQPADNPMRGAAYARAQPRVRVRYRCTSE